MNEILLASTSPRRNELLTQLLGNRFKVMRSTYEEDNLLKLSPKRLIMHHARQKGRDVARRVQSGVVISADTLVVFKGKVLGKPYTNEAATAALQKISGKKIKVITGVSVIDVKKKTEWCECEVTVVKIKKLSEKEIAAYVATGEPLDKAGAFGIQEKGVFLVEKIIGDYTNVVGLPLFRLARMLEKAGILLFE